MTQAALAREAPCGRSHVAHVERASRSPRTPSPSSATRS
ncbi:hypothetical protein [Streptomyces sp. MUM 203J]|nr:hypothetical protein [Streptomyces sp. MUM 203J]